MEYSKAVVFPGQGSQKPGMAQDFYNEFEGSRRAFEEAADALGMDIAAICFADEDPRLNQTEFTQPAIVTAEIAMYRYLASEYGFKPEFFAGHSLGEYSALVAADVIPFADAVRIVHKRGALMQEAVPMGVGSMAAIIYPDIENADLVGITSRAGAEIANMNSKEQIVISGEKEAVKRAADDFREYIVKTHGEEGASSLAIHFLEVSAPFHTTLMKPIEKAFQEFLNHFSGNFKSENAVRVLSNFTGKFHSKENLIENLVSQISGSVQWIENMRLLIEKSSEIYEVGPGRPLSKFFRMEGKDIQSILNLRSCKKTFGKE